MSQKEILESYKSILKHYSRLKRKPWKDFERYYTMVKSRFNLPKSGIILDAGAGNCRNLLVFDDSWFKIGVDISVDLLKESVIRKNNTALSVANVVNLPIRRESVDLILCIAVLHHLIKEEEVIKALKDMERILSKGGFVILSLWRRWRADIFAKMLKELVLYPIKKIKQRNWRFGDYYLPWYNEKKEVIGLRYYHLFTKREILKIIKRTKLKLLDIQTLGGKSGRDNLFLLLTK